MANKMEGKNVIIILIVIIIILAAAIGFTLLNPASAKEPTKINITSDSEQYENGGISVELTDLNGTPMSKEIVNVTIANSKGELVVDDVVKTNSDGKAKLDFELDEGNYTVNVTYGGNENHTASNTTQKLTVKQEEKTAESAPETSQSSEPVDYNSPNSKYYKWDTDGSYHLKEPGKNYIYAQDAVTGEWSYWADKS